MTATAEEALRPGDMLLVEPRLGLPSMALPSPKPSMLRALEDVL